jgi:hypothetical protein
MCEISYVSGAIVGFGWNNLYGDTGRLDCMWVYMGEGEFSICTGLTGMNGKNRVLVVKCTMGTTVFVFFAPAEWRA